MPPAETRMQEFLRKSGYALDGAGIVLTTIDTGTTLANSAVGAVADPIVDVAETGVGVADVIPLTTEIVNDYGGVPSYTRVHDKRTIFDVDKASLDLVILSENKKVQNETVISILCSDLDKINDREKKKNKGNK